MIIRDRVRVRRMLPFLSSSKRKLCFNRILFMRKRSNRRFQGKTLIIKSKRRRANLISFQRITRRVSALKLTRCRGAHRIILINFSTFFRCFRTMRQNNRLKASNHVSTRIITTSGFNDANDVFYFCGLSVETLKRGLTTLRRDRKIKICFHGVLYPIFKRTRRAI